MSAVFAAAGAAVVGAGYKIYSGEKQKSQAKKLAEENVFIPEAMPGQVRLATNLAAQNYYNGMPGADQARADIDRNAANSVYYGSQGASSGGDLLDLAGRINTNKNNAYNRLANDEAAYRVDALGRYTGALNAEAGWEDRLYQNNVRDPYQQKAQTAAALYGAGNINVANGIDGIGTAAAVYANSIGGGDGSVRTFGDSRYVRNNPLGPLGRTGY